MSAVHGNIRLKINVSGTTDKIKTEFDSWENVVVICRRAGDKRIINGSRQKIIDFKLWPSSECCMLSSW